VQLPFWGDVSSTSDAVGSVVFAQVGTAPGSRSQTQQGRPRRDGPLAGIQENGYCFIFSKNVSGLTNKTTCPGCGVAVTLPHVFAEAYPWSRTSFVLKFLSPSGERSPSPDPHTT